MQQIQDEQVGEYVRLSEGTQAEMKELVQNQGKAKTHVVGTGAGGRGLEKKPPRLNRLCSLRGG